MSTTTTPARTATLNDAGFFTPQSDWQHELDTMPLPRALGDLLAHLDRATSPADRATAEIIRKAIDR